MKDHRTRNAIKPRTLVLKTHIHTDINIKIIKRIHI